MDRSRLARSLSWLGLHTSPISQIERGFAQRPSDDVDLFTTAAAEQRFCPVNFSTRSKRRG
ncbi:hypothetical protein [Pseudonocardia humida]|uniref:Uncharacterized protein n=1 Tax=Pseudonocardia humida TaxID=2800819 RepID=A0ABT1A9S7_9PSEU|nr:hypothetical protein [Pseudonocardia humida]MCO1659784.1 hypothetical protein [Pseudonocardia humida]